MKTISGDKKESDDLFLDHQPASKEQNSFEPSGRHQPMLGWFSSAGF